MQQYSRFTFATVIGALSLIAAGAANAQSPGGLGGGGSIGAVPGGAAAAEAEALAAAGRQGVTLTPDSTVSRCGPDGAQIGAPVPSGETSLLPEEDLLTQQFGRMRGQDVIVLGSPVVICN